MDNATLYILSGLPGSGKSEVAKIIEEHLNCLRLNTDIIRKKFISDPTYSPEEKARVYAIMLEQAKLALLSNMSVILDGTFSIEERRRQAYELAPENAATVLILVFCSDEEEAERRMLERTARGDNPSDADYSVREVFRSNFEYPGPNEPCIEIDTVGSKQDLQARVLAGLADMDTSSSY